MNWYLTKLVFQITICNNQTVLQFEEQLRIVQAVSKEAAFEKATAIGYAEEGSVSNIANGSLIHWKFINITDLYQLQALLDGAALFSCVHEIEESQRYINSVHKKASHIQNSNTLELLQLV
ncbi:MAG: DUF4288 domain-containing protein [Sphingobacteriales bacterium]|jgi:Domain of unknown function (DUF4288)|nr:MAG: DUF4288 domain-containing protein [Sphingobacteriales bacterium]